MTIKFPKLRGERVIIVALLMILIAECITTLWHLEKLGADEKFHLQKYLTDLLNSFGYLLLIVSLIITGIRTMRKKWPSYKGIAMTVIGLCMCAIPLLSIQMYKKIGKNLDELPKPNFEMMKSKLDKGDLPLKSKIFLSKMYAHDKYLYEGVIVDYLSDSDVMTRYVPTKEDIELKKLKTETKEIWDYNNKRLHKVFWEWIAVIVIILLLGVLTPIQKTPPNQRSDHERA